MRNGSVSSHYELEDGEMISRFLDPDGALNEIINEAKKACEWCRRENALCLETNTVGLACTRDDGHKGQHAACGLMEHPMQWWPR